MLSRENFARLDAGRALTFARFFRFCDGPWSPDTKELEAELKAGGETDETIAELIKEHDANGDGFIDFNEFANILRNRASSKSRSRNKSRGKSRK